MLDKLLEHFHVFENDLGHYVEDEVLYGISGYLYCMLVILHKIDKKNQRAIKRIKVLVKVIIEDGLKWSKDEDYILIKWPRERKEKKYYLGGAHGLMGVL